ncbi:MAG: DMT family transporter [Candidatus Latescibacteria bacterium]|nr:DMT family transporter [Candidatus Latescibacterota bacterium]
MEKYFKKDMIGVLMMLLSAALFSFMALFVRLASKTMPVGMIVCVRYAFSVLFFIPLIAMKQIKIRPVNHRLLLYRALAAGFGGLFYFLAIANISLAEAVILKYTFPLFAIAVSAIFYGEKTGRLVIFLLLWSFIGVFVMMNPNSFSFRIGYVWGILNAVSAGAAVAFLRKLRATDDSTTTTFFTAVAGTVISLPMLLIGLQIPTVSESVLLLSASIMGLSAQYVLAYGMRFIKTGAASVIMMVEVVIASVLGFSILGQIPTIHQLLGGAMIVLGGAVLIVRQGNNKAKKI